MKKVYRYYCLHRPPMPGTVPRGMVKIEDYGDRVAVKEIDRHAWGYVEYERRLSANEIGEYELAPAPIDNDIRG